MVLADQERSKIMMLRKVFTLSTEGGWSCSVLLEFKEDIPRHCGGQSQVVYCSSC